MALLLCDIDGTLLRPVGLGRRAFEGAVADLFGRLPEGPRFPYDGLLDTQIARMTLEAMGVEASSDVLGRLLDGYVARLETERPPDPASLRLPGVEAFLTEAAARGHRLALLTGNVRRGAEIKLAMADLDRHFPRDAAGALLGAFGDDAPDRPSLAPLALQRCAGAGRAGGAAWIVGDSPRDVETAKASGLRCAAVATGLTPAHALEALEPDLVLAGLDRAESLWPLLEEERPA